MVGRGKRGAVFRTQMPSLGGERGGASGVTWCLGEERDGEGVSKMGGAGPGVTGLAPSLRRAMASDPLAVRLSQPRLPFWVSAVRSSRRLPVF